MNENGKEKDMALKNCSKEYADIIDLPHHVSKTRPQMSMRDRAAQFSPFAALTGYEAAISETARVTEEKIELDENVRKELDEKLELLIEKIPERQTVRIRYFQKDERKAGGSYESAEGVVKKIDFYNRMIVMEDELRIRMEDVVGIELTLVNADGNM